MIFLMKQHRGLIALAVILAVVIADQLLKIYVKTHFYLGEEEVVTSWFRLKFIENPGMAFGLELWNKLVLTLGRMAAVALFIWMLVKVHAARVLRTGFIVSLALITAGAAGNIFDCVFYGRIFNNPFPPEVARMFPAGGGYAEWFEGRVVDMFYFPFFTIDIAGHSWEFFQYIFNIADAAICVGVMLLIFFYSKDIAIAWDTFCGRGANNQVEKAPKS